MTTQEIIASFATLDENGNVTSFNFADFDALVSELVTERAKIRKDNKEAIKAQKEADNETLAKAGKEYYDALKVGDEFDYKTADGTVVHARKIETKSKSGNSAACEVLFGITCAKSNKRYPKFYQVIVPPLVEETVEETPNEDY
jgi:hypothetical protein